MFIKPWALKPARNGIISRDKKSEYFVDNLNSIIALDTINHFMSFVYIYRFNVPQI